MIDRRFWVVRLSGIVVGLFCDPVVVVVESKKSSGNRSSFPSLAY